MPRLARWPILVAVAGIAACTAPGRAAAQVFQVQGGGSSLYSGYGGTMSVWANGWEGALGLGYLDGLRVSAFVERRIGRDTLRIGDDIVPMLLPSDLFSSASGLLVQGVGIRRTTRRARVYVFGGAGATALPSPFFSALRAEKGLGIVQAERDLSPTLTAITHAIVSDRHTLLQGLRWRPSPEVTTALTAGMGASEPYGAAAVSIRHRWADLKAAYVRMSERFRRTDAPMPVQSEIDRENVLLTLHPFSTFSLSVGRQNFRHDTSLAGPPSRATVNQLFGTARVAGVTASAGAFESFAGAERTVSSFVGAGRALGSWIQTDLFLLRVWEPVLARSTSPVLHLREFISPRLSLLQVIGYENRRATISLGGSFTSGLASVSLDYHIVHTPYRIRKPFAQALALAVKLQLGGYQLDGTSFVTPDGRVNYTATGSTFLYMNASGAGSGRPFELRFERYLVQGRVVDEDERPVEGAAVRIGDDIVFSDSQGRFFHRVGGSRPLAVRVALDEFTLPGRWEVVAAPDTATPAREPEATPVTIVVRKAR
jgi:hypothetical protein